MITVLVPTYNRPQLLPDALQSVAVGSQLVDTLVQCLVINDGGTPVDTFLTPPRAAAAFEFENAPHGGLSAALNIGLALAEGTSCMVLPDDDELLPDGLLRLHLALRAAGPETVAAWGLPQYRSPAGAPLPRPKQLLPFMQRYPLLRWEHLLAGSGLWVHGAALLYRTSALRAIGGWDAGMPTAEEYDLNLRLLHAGGQFLAVPYDVVTYRRGGKSQDPAVRALRAEALARCYARLGTTRAAWNAKLQQEA